MKLTLLLIAFASPLIAAPSLSPEALAEIKRISPVSQLPQPEAGDNKPSTPVPPPSLLNESVILNDGKHWTLLPKGAVIHIPKIMHERVSAKPVGTLLEWDAFLNQNRGWISTCEVTFDQARGTVPLDAQQIEFWKTQDKIMVAVHSGGPISVRPGSESAANPDISQK